MDTRKSNNELRQKIERARKINLSRNHGAGPKGDIYVYMHNVIRRNPRKNISKKFQRSRVSKAFDVINRKITSKMYVLSMVISLYNHFFSTLSPHLIIYFAILFFILLILVTFFR
jgi:Ca2+-dependent lipid-binding protein